jgi:CysZ protein
MLLSDFISNFKLSIRAYKKSWNFVIEQKLWWYFFIPIILFVGIYYLGFTFQNLENTTTANPNDGFFETTWITFKKVVFGLMALFIFNFMRYIIIILMSPLLSIVSEKVEQVLTGNIYKFNLDQLIKDVKRSINLSIRNMIWELGIILIIYISSYILLLSLGLTEYLNYVTFPLTMFVGFYYYGFGFMDYINERRRLNIEESVIFVRKNKGFAVGLGLVFTVVFHYSNYLFSLIGNDVSGLMFFMIVALIAIITATIPIYTMVAATIGMHDLVDLTKNPHALKDK